MIGSFNINGIDSYSNFEVLLTERGYNSLVAYPSLKPVDFNDWPEEDGIEADLSNPVLDSKDVSLDLVSKDPYKLELFFAEIFSNGVNQLEVLDEQFDLRFTSHPTSKRITNVNVFSLNFKEDKPFSTYSYVGPTSGIDIDQGYSLDGANLNDYRIYVLEGTREELKEHHPNKENLTVSSKYISGIEYDSGIFRQKQKTAKLKLLLHANSLEVFWRNYKAFLFDLKRANERTLTSPEGEFKFYYNSCQVQKFSYSNTVWCQFDLSIVVVNVLAPNTSIQKNVRVSTGSLALQGLSIVPFSSGYPYTYPFVLGGESSGYPYIYPFNIS